jgi:DNA-binding MarR family transcriptional regulator
MKLESELKQKKTLGSERIRMMVNILFTASWTKEIAQKHFKTFGLTNEQFNVLRILRGSYPQSLNVGDILNRMVDKSSNVTRLIAKLLQKELVTRTVLPENKRLVHICITEKGLELLSKIDEAFPLLEKRMENLTEEEAQNLNNLLDKLRG